MAINYSGTTIGKFTLVQKNGSDEKPRKYEIEIRDSNCMAAFLHIYKQDNPDNPKLCWVHQLIMFFCDEQHLKNIKRDYKKNFFEGLFCGKLENIRLNVYYKNMATLMKYMVRDGLEVKCYYKEPKEK